MVIRPDTVRLLDELDALSGRRLRRREDFAVVLDAGMSPSQHEALADLAFSAKFLTRAQEMLRRIGRDGEGYDRLAAEFSAHLEKAGGLLRAVLGAAPAPARSDLEARYLSMTPASVENLLGLCADLRWYKNWLIDRRSGASTAP